MQKPMRIWDTAEDPVGSTRSAFVTPWKTALVRDAGLNFNFSASLRIHLHRLNRSAL